MQHRKNKKQLLVLDHKIFTKYHRTLSVRLRIHPVYPLQKSVYGTAGCRGMWNHPHKNGLIQIDLETKPKLAKGRVIGYLLYTVFPYVYIYFKNTLAQSAGAVEYSDCITAEK